MDQIFMLSNEVNRLRLAAGLEKGQLAEKAKISRATMARVFGSRPVGWDTARAIAKVLNVRVHHLIQEARPGIRRGPSSNGVSAALVASPGRSAADVN